MLFTLTKTTTETIKPNILHRTKRKKESADWENTHTHTLYEIAKISNGQRNDTNIHRKHDQVGIISVLWFGLKLLDRRTLNNFGCSSFLSLVFSFFGRTVYIIWFCSNVSECRSKNVCMCVHRARCVGYDFRMQLWIWVYCIGKSHFVFIQNKRCACVQPWTLSTRQSREYQNKTTTSKRFYGEAQYIVTI